jgi:hypothetical protein
MNPDGFQQLAAHSRLSFEAQWKGLLVQWLSTCGLSERRETFFVAFELCSWCLLRILRILRFFRLR